MTQSGLQAQGQCVNEAIERKGLYYSGKDEVGEEGNYKLMKTEGRQRI